MCEQPPNELVPQTQSIDDVYATDPASGAGMSPEQRSRWNNVVSLFRRRYGASPDFVSRSPGRVNIIGEHIDYSLYDVLPTALSVDVLVAIRVLPNKGENERATVALSNKDEQKFPPRWFDVAADGDIEINPSTLDWANYFKAGMRVALNFLRWIQGDKFNPVSIEALMDGTVPPGGGVSSSAAVVCSSALAVVKAHGHDISKQDLQDTAIVSERAVGVYSGGMDQAASIFSRRGYLLYTRFFPEFYVQHVPVPRSDPEITFIVAQTFVAADKAVTAPKRYNLRVAECTLAAVVLAKLNNVSLPRDSTALGYSLRSFHHEFMLKEGRVSDPLEYQLDSIILSTMEQLTQEKGYTREQIAQILQIPVAELNQKYFSTFPVHAERFFLRQRSLHCFKEARRVLDFKYCLIKHASSGLEKHTVNYLGQLLNSSQESCKILYDCSCPEIDNICSIVRREGAIGSRLTGAGWGGCTVHMVPQSRISDVIQALKTEYYFKKFPDITEEKLRDALVISKPSNGSFLIYGIAISGVP